MGKPYMIRKDKQGNDEKVSRRFNEKVYEGNRILQKKALKAYLKGNKFFNYGKKFDIELGRMMPVQFVVPETFVKYAD